MKLLTKLNLVLILFSGASGIVIGHVAYGFLMDNARDQVLQQAELMMASASVTRDYTSVDLKPLLMKNPDHRTHFLPETVPAFAANSIFSRMRKDYANYSYREATLNPTNPADKADTWETDVIRWFNDHRDSSRAVGERDTPMGRQLYLAKPMVVQQSCLECHSIPKAAPAAMIKKYGSANGFGWQTGQVITAQIVTVPMSVPIEVANKAFRSLILFLIGTFVISIAAFDVVFYMMVIRPLRRVCVDAGTISRGQTDIPELDVRGNDEIAEVMESFNRMHRSLTKALRMLGH
jgi:protein-histidine pros-kinase